MHALPLKVGDANAVCSLPTQTRVVEAPSLCLSLAHSLLAADLDCLMALSLLAIGLAGVLVAVN